MLLSPLFRPATATAETSPNRIALAISGGASMGAYEAGLIWGLVEVLRQLDTAEKGALIGEPRPIDIASIAGTSAGGINTVLAALAWSVNPEIDGGFVNRVDDNIFRDVWLTPDVNRLLPADPNSPLFLPDDALLSRQDLVAVARELAEKWRQPGSFRSGLRLPLGVTVTRVKPDTLTISGVSVSNQRFYIPFEMRTQADGSAQFAFDPDDYPSLNDPAMILMPWPADGVPLSISDRQVEDALLTTSAFPGGFGRKRLQYCRQEMLQSDQGREGQPAMETAGDEEWVCPEGYVLAEAEFADGGLFDNLPIGLARRLAEDSLRHQQTPLPVKYIYLDPNRERYVTDAPVDRRACEGETPPQACRQMAFNLESETEVLGGAIGTARTYELYRELTSDNWRLNLSQLSREMADRIDATARDLDCDRLLPYFDQPLKCSDRLRYAARLLELNNTYHLVPIHRTFSTQALLQAGIAGSCGPASSAADGAFDAQCRIDATRLRKTLAEALVELSAAVLPEEENLAADIRQSALSTDWDRSIHVTSRGGPITGLLLDAFGAFLDYKFREFDYHVGVYDAIVLFTGNQCQGNFPTPDQQPQQLACRDRLSEKLYRLLGVADDPKSRYTFALMARREFGPNGGLRFAYDPMPPEEPDIGIIFEGLDQTLLAADRGKLPAEEVPSTEKAFFAYLKAEGFVPTPPLGGGTPLLTLIMDDPDYWTHELVNRATDRLVYLEKQAESIYQAREPDPDLQDQANATLMGASALTLRTAAYNYPTFAFAPSTAPETWFWRNVIPYEVGFDLVEGDTQLFWQPTWHFKQINAGLRLGLGFTGGLFKSNADEQRENYGVFGLDLTRIERTGIFSGWGVTPAVYHTWQAPENSDQTTFGLDLHVNFLKNRVRISLGARDVIHAANDTLFFSVGIADLPGLFYWLSR
jgi:predicted acylesterase/phospholipase RssA